MREVCKSGTVVAAVVAVLEKQSRQMTPVPKPPPVPPRNPDNIQQNSPSFSAKNSDEPRKPTNLINSNKSDFKNRNTQESAFDENYFERAVQDFNSVAEDVEKTFCGDAVAKLNVKSDGELRRRNCVTIDLKSEDEERKTETCGGRSRFAAGPEPAKRGYFMAIYFPAH